MILAAGATACLPKPFGVEELVSLASSILRASAGREGPWPTDVRHLGPGDLAALAALPRDELDALPFGAIALDREGSIVEYNAYEQEASTHVRSDVVGMRFQDLAPCTTVRKFAARLEGVTLVGVVGIASATRMEARPLNKLGVRLLFITAPAYRPEDRGRIAACDGATRATAIGTARRLERGGVAVAVREVASARRHPQWPPQNSCRNDATLNELGAALTASEAEVERLKAVLNKIAERTSWIGVPMDTEAASYLGQELQEIVFEAQAALTSAMCDSTDTPKVYGEKP